MQDIPEQRASRRARIILYLVGVAAMAVPWGYLLFVRPWLRAHRRSPIAPRAAFSVALALLARAGATRPPHRH